MPSARTGFCILPAVPKKSNVVPGKNAGCIRQDPGDGSKAPEQRSPV